MASEVKDWFLAREAGVDALESGVVEEGNAADLGRPAPAGAGDGVALREKGLFRTEPMVYVCVWGRNAQERVEKVIERRIVMGKRGVVGRRWIEVEGRVVI